jgi:hypothetical protein
MSPGTLAFADYLIPQRAGNSGARVRFVVHPQQLADEGMCVSLRGRERAVVKPLMNAAKVCVKKMAVLGVLFLSVLAASARAQNNYEIQVYGSDLVEPGHTMVELHSNFTIQGFKTMMDGVYPDNHAEHETVEITHGFTSRACSRRSSSGLSRRKVVFHFRIASCWSVETHGLCAALGQIASHGYFLMSLAMEPPLPLRLLQ